MTKEEEKKKLQEAEEKIKNKQRPINNKKDYDKVIHEDGTLASFGFSDNYK
jgi:hypothetical protein